MWERILCRLKMGLLLVLFFLPVITLLWHQREIARLESIRYTEPIIQHYYAQVDDDAALDGE